MNQKKNGSAHSVKMAHNNPYQISPERIPDVFSFDEINKFEYVSYCDEKGNEYWGQVIEKERREHANIISVRNFSDSNRKIDTMEPAFITSRMCQDGNQKLWNSSREKWFCPFCKEK